MEWVAVAAEEAEAVRAMDADTFFAWLDDEDHRRSFEVHKSWHAVHFTLTGSAWEPVGPLGDVVLGGEEFGEDLGYGPARWLPPNEVARLADALDALGADAFVTRFDLDGMRANDIYSWGWQHTDAAGPTAEDLRGPFEVIRAGYRAAADAGQGMVIVIT